jgi:Flp pilus assembly pilin Flp
LESAQIVLRAIWKFLHKNELGQDLAEYCLLTALVVLIALGILYRVAGGMDGILGSLNTTLAAGNGNSGTSTSTSTGTSQTPGN